MNADTDILIIGGGIHGCGVAQAAAANGYRVLLLEQGRLASGTSSRSSKLVHGGLRYLESGQLPLVYEALHERSVLLRIAPHLVRKQAFFIPVYRDNLRPPWQIAAGLGLYTLLALGQGGCRWFARSEWEALLPGLNQDGLRAVFRYWDAATDDAQLTRAVAASARQYGAELLEHTGFVAARAEAGQWRVELADGSTVTARALVNAAGPWVAEVQRRIADAPPLPPLEYVQGSHVLFDAPQQAYVYAEALDHRPMFIMPWHGQTLMGTTETAFAGDPAKVAPSADEIEQICTSYRRHYPNRNHAPITSFAGVRVLPKAEAGFNARSRSTLLFADKRAKPLWVSVCGGKLTTYRNTSAKVLRLLRRGLPDSGKRVDTGQLHLPELG